METPFSKSVFIVAKRGGRAIKQSKYVNHYESFLIQHRSPHKTVLFVRFTDLTIGELQSFAMPSIKDSVKTFIMTECRNEVMSY